MQAAGYVSPAEILALPKASLPKKSGSQTRRKGNTKILTDTPVRNEIESRKKKCSTPAPAKRGLFQSKNTKEKRRQKATPSVSSSTSEEEMDMDLVDDSEDEEELEEIIEGDFVIVQVSGKSRVAQYIARIDIIDGDELEGVFLKRISSRVDIGPPRFVLNDGDEASFAREDILKKLPVPKYVGGTARCENQFIFKVDLSSWNLK